MKQFFTLVFLHFSLLVFAQKADIILYNGKIFTSDKKKLYQEALAIKGDKIVAVGKNDVITKMAGSTTKKIDLKGKTVIPGFNDAHDHTGPDYPARRFVLQNLPTDPTPWETVKDSLLRLVQEVPVGTLIKTTINPDLFDDERARLQTLDSIAPLHPVILAAWTGHGVIVNSKAMELFGFSADTKALGGQVEMNAGGKPNGILHEYAAYPISAILAGKMKLADVMADLHKFYKEALSLGITSQQIMTTAMPASLFRQIYTANDFGIRSRLIAFPFTNNKELLFAEWAPFFGRLNKKNEISGVKLILDGTPGERLATLTTAYNDRPGTYGALDFDDYTVKKYIQFCLQKKQQIMVHAVGDSTIKKVISLMRSMHPDAFWKNKRVRIEHGDLAIMTKADFKTIQDLSIIIVENPMHHALPQLIVQRWGNRTNYLQAMRSLVDNNIPLAIGSDGPINPFLNIMMAAIHPNNSTEAITVEEAVMAYTYGSAFAEFKEKEKGTLTVGKLADLAVLSQDIFTLPLNMLPATQSVLTMVGGKIFYTAPVQK